MTCYAITTRYYSTRAGAGRIRAAWPGPGSTRTLSIPFPHEARDPHRAAAQALLDRERAGLGWYYRIAAVGALRDGYVYVVEPDEAPA